jgi:CheY-like chemotaxis protein
MTGVKNILLVDDDPGVTFLNRYMLQSGNVQGNITVAEHGMKALEAIAATGNPDVIFLDVNMPVMDGFEFLDALKTNAECYEHVQVYMLSSSLRESDKAKALAHSCVKKYFEKPLTEEMVKEVFD